MVHNRTTNHACKACPFQCLVQSGTVQSCNFSAPPIDITAHKVRPQLFTSDSIKHAANRIPLFAAGLSLSRLLLVGYPPRRSRRVAVRVAVHFICPAVSLSAHFVSLVMSKHRIAKNSATA